MHCSKRHLKLFIAFIIWIASSGGFQSLQCLLQDGSGCPSKLCPNTTVIYTCNVPPLSSQLGYTRWSTGNCPNGLPLRQPSVAGCVTNQSVQCGQFTASLSIPCTTASLLVMVTQDLNGSIIGCQNFESRNSIIENLGSATVMITGSKYINGPGSPTVYAQQNCTSVAVVWVPSASGDPAISFTVRIEGHLISQVVTVDEGSNYSLYFGGLESNSLYTISVTAKNCAGSSAKNVAVFTLSTPPTDVQAVHVGIGSNNVQLVAVWMQQTVQLNQWYTLRISGNDLSPWVINVSCNSSICYYSPDLRSITISPPYGVEVATFSNGQLGPYSPIVKSDASSSTFLYVTSTALYNTVNVTCLFLDGSSHQCFICCQYELQGPYTVSLLTSTRGIKSSGVISNMSRGHTYQCIAAAGDESTVCEGAMGTGGVQFNISTLPDIKIVGGTVAEVYSQDIDHVTVQCSFYDGSSHYCLLCCNTDQSVQVYTYSNISSIRSDVVTVDLYGLKPGAVYYCKASPAESDKTLCPDSGVPQSWVIFLGVGIGSSVISIILFSLLLYGCYAIKKDKSIIPSYRLNFGPKKKNNLGSSQTKSVAKEMTHSTPLQQLIEAEAASSDSYSYIKAKHSRKPVDKIPFDQPEPTVPTIIYEQYDYIKTQRSAAILTTNPMNPYVSNSEVYVESIKELHK